MTDRLKVCPTDSASTDLHPVTIKKPRSYESLTPKHRMLIFLGLQSLFVTINLNETGRGL